MAAAKKESQNLLAGPLLSLRSFTRVEPGQVNQPDCLSVREPTAVALGSESLRRSFWCLLRLSEMPFVTKPGVQAKGMGVGDARGSLQTVSPDFPLQCIASAPSGRGLQEKVLGVA